MACKDRSTSNMCRSRAGAQPAFRSRSPKISAPHLSEGPPCYLNWGGIHQTSSHSSSSSHVVLPSFRKLPTRQIGRQSDLYLPSHTTLRRSNFALMPELVTRQ